MGIDPGKTGGIAIINPVANTVETLSMTNKTEMDIYDWMVENDRPTKCIIEKVHGMPGQRGMFEFGKSFGFLIGLITARQIPFELVIPNKWQKFLGCQTKGDKNVTKRKAQQLFPQLKITHAIADALLIAEYCWRTNNNDS